jgi:hypothetical protein
MKRISLAVLASLALALGLSGPASAANSNASCSGLAGSSRAGDAGAEADTQVDIKAAAQHEGVTPGAIVSGFSRDHLGSAEVCLD